MKKQKSTIISGFEIEFDCLDAERKSIENKLNLVCSFDVTILK